MKCVAQVYRVRVPPEARLRFVILAEVVERTRLPALRSPVTTPFLRWLTRRPGSSVVERGPEKAGVGGSIPSLATICYQRHSIFSCGLFQSGPVLLAIPEPIAA